MSRKPIDAGVEPSGISSADPGWLSVRKALFELTGGAAQILEELEGGASTRQFFRVAYRGKPAIAMFSPAPSQEIAKAKQACGYGSFVEVARLLQRYDIAVPKILAASETQPVLIVEDLGSYTLAAYLLAYPDRKEALYRQAVEMLAHAQQRLNPLSQDSIIVTRAFDYDLLLWEVEHFKEWALLSRGFHLNAAERKIFDQSAHFLASSIAGWERGFVHRDYQSRNIMVRGEVGQEQLCWIDFQDAMLGPRVYDLVALLTDSYQSFSEDFTADRLAEYCQIVRADDRSSVEREVALVTVQRKLKDAGRFIFLDRVNKNPNFLKYVDATIEKARRALAKVRDLGPLGDLETLLDRRFGPLESRRPAV